MDPWSLAILPPCSIVRIVHTRSLCNRQLNFNLKLLLHSLRVFKKMVLKETNNEPQICKFGSNNCASCCEQIKHSFIFLGGVCCHEKFVMLSWTDYILTLFMPYCKYCKLIYYPGFIITFQFLYFLASNILSLLYFVAQTNVFLLFANLCRDLTWICWISSILSRRMCPNSRIVCQERISESQTHLLSLVGH